MSAEELDVGYHACTLLAEPMARAEQALPYLVDSCSLVMALSVLLAGTFLVAFVKQQQDKLDQALLGERKAKAEAAEAMRQANELRNRHMIAETEPPPYLPQPSPPSELTLPPSPPRFPPPSALRRAKSSPCTVMEKLAAEGELEKSCDNEKDTLDVLAPTGQAIVSPEAKLLFVTGYDKMSDEINVAADLLAREALTPAQQPHMPEAEQSLRREEVEEAVAAGTPTDYFGLLD